MSDISNKTLAILVGVAICISLVGIFAAQRGVIVTGMASTGTGQVNLTITEITSILVTNNIDFGAGYVNDSAQDWAYLYSNNASTTYGNWSFSAQSVHIKNDGSVNVTLDIKTSKNATGFIGGTSPDFKFFVNETEATACFAAVVNGSSYSTGDFGPNYNISKDLRVCNNLKMEQAANELDMYAYVKVPKNAKAEAKTTTITFTAGTISN